MLAIETADECGPFDYFLPKTILFTLDDEHIAHRHLGLRRAAKLFARPLAAAVTAKWTRAEARRGERLGLAAGSLAVLSCLGLEFRSIGVGLGTWLAGPIPCSRG